MRTSAFFIACALFLGCGAPCATQDTSGDTQGGGGSGAGSGTSSAGSGGEAPEPVGCATEADCTSWVNPECGVMRCKKGLCVAEAYTPPYTCGSPDPDDTGPWESRDPTVGHCFGGQCCFGCIVDSGSNPREHDVFDGPCVGGASDDFCGAAGELCLNCAIKGLICKAGACVMDP